MNLFNVIMIKVLAENLLGAPIVYQSDIVCVLMQLDCVFFLRKQILIQTQRTNKANKLFCFLVFSLCVRARVRLLSLSYTVSGQPPVGRVRKSM